jgi:hypothetical protein
MNKNTKRNKIFFFEITCNYLLTYIILKKNIKNKIKVKTKSVKESVLINIQIIRLTRRKKINN